MLTSEPEMACDLLWVLPLSYHVGTQLRALRALAR